ncbi:hypothetical protein DFR72_107333 [Lentzea flaviverrucosa]|uniref:Uncharacterized protein n=1 Tax=Lentzea flaviverrucosa TaxID=200379 RepID=A0A1H9JZQ9_9PSEU|nr:hypothetical protein DFR72_107333 [Lentzea flaviverrucosa]SEQ92304.1 hypothetical protein SAMN05216195_103426 [Lentzea flaviverrucosa]
MNIRRLFRQRTRNKSESRRRVSGTRRTTPAAAGGTAPPAGVWQAVLGTWFAVLRVSVLLVVVTLLAYAFEMTFAVGPFEIGASQPCGVPEVVHVPIPVPEIAPVSVSKAF